MEGVRKLESQTKPLTNHRSHRQPSSSSCPHAHQKDETAQQRQQRLLLEAEAKAISDAIDEQLSKERALEKKGSKPVKVLLLGQSESGKSTTLKNFQLMYDPKAFRAERASWRAVIQLNVLRSTHVLLDIITRAEVRQVEEHGAPVVDEELLALRYRLSPLINLEEVLMQRLVPNGPDHSDAARLAQLSQVPYAQRPRNVKGEVVVNSASAWKDAFARAFDRDTSSVQTEDLVDWDDPADPGALLHRHSEDLQALWANPLVQALLVQQNLRLQEAAGFFLDCLDEVTSLKYIPSDDHILRARLKTIGVSEHRIKMTSGGMTGSISRDWRIYDVGGHRSLVRIHALLVLARGDLFNSERLGRLSLTTCIRSSSFVRYRRSTRSLRRNRALIDWPTR
ncbi:hypothetical protein MKEN_00597000 [Mycena kentingensis (nom. inval.)]|nr:hypothetical protein MKEN_00597000 [Mycena kentingensis (nom. inval.)]